MSRCASRSTSPTTSANASDITALAEEIVDRAGVLDANSSKTEKALRLGQVQGTIWNIVVDEGSQRLQQVDEAAAAGMRVLIRRDDFRSEMLFDYLSMHGAPGIVIHNKIVEYLTNEQFTTDFAEILQEQHTAGDLALIGQLEQATLDLAGGDNEATPELLGNWRRSLVAHAQEKLGDAGLSEHYAKLDAVVNRPDCSTEMVYEFLLSLGTSGREIAEDWRSKLFHSLDPDAPEERPAHEGYEVKPEDNVQPARESNAIPPSDPSSQPEPGLTMSPVETFDMEMVKRYLDKEGFKYLSTEHGFLTLSFTEEYGLSWDVRLNAEGEPDNQIYVLRSSTFDMAIPREGWEKALVLCNDWNTNMRWPTVCLYAEDPATDTVARLLSMSQFDCGAGIHQELLDDLTRRFLSGSGKFWERAHQELGHPNGTGVSEANEFQSDDGEEPPAAIVEEPLMKELPEPIPMPIGLFTFAGHYPGYEPAQAMAAFLSVREHGRPPYEELVDSGWGFGGDGYKIICGCFVKSDGTPVIVVTCHFETEQGVMVANQHWSREKAVLEKSASSTRFFNADELEEAIAYGDLRQLRLSAIGPIPDSASGKPTEELGSSLRFDGLYQAEGASYHSYLRFYADGTVLQVSTNGRPEQLARWFGKTHSEVPRGTYAVEGQSIEFSTASSEGTVTYKGRVFENTVELSSHSYIDGREDRATYSFVLVDLQ